LGPHEAAPWSVHCPDGAGIPAATFSHFPFEHVWQVEQSLLFKHCTQLPFPSHTVPPLALHDVPWFESCVPQHPLMQRFC
jgi:hypothetical protein